MGSCVRYVGVMESCCMYLLAAGGGCVYVDRCSLADMLESIMYGHVV